MAMIYHQGVNISFLFFAGKTQTMHGVVMLLAVAMVVRILADRRSKSSGI